MLAAAHERIYQHSLPLEDARAQAAYGQHSQVGKILEIHQELPGRIHVVLIRQPVGFDGVVHRGGYDPPALLAALAP